MSRPLLVAIVDDDVGMRGSIESLLRSGGIEGYYFAAAEDLLASDAAARVDCIVTDIHMPGMSGPDLQIELTRRGWRQPLILMTAYPTDTARERAMLAGAHAFLTKPIDPDALLAAIEALRG